MMRPSHNHRKKTEGVITNILKIMGRDKPKQ